MRGHSLRTGVRQRRACIFLFNVFSLVYLSHLAAGAFEFITVITLELKFDIYHTAVKSLSSQDSSADVCSMG